MVGLCLILIKNSFSFIMQQFFYPHNMHFQNGRNIPISSFRLTAVVDELQELLKVIFVINLNLNLLSIYWHSLICFGWFMNQSSDVRRFFLCETQKWIFDCMSKCSALHRTAKCK
jgi:hypothetical protein